MRHELARFLTPEELQALPTKRLLAYKKKLWRSHPESEDWTFYCKCSGCVATRKQHTDFDCHLNNVRQVLATREHVPTPGKEAISAANRERKSWHSKKAFLKKLAKNRQLKPLISYYI